MGRGQNESDFYHMRRQAQGLDSLRHVIVAPAMLAMETSALISMLVQHLAWPSQLDHTSAGIQDRYAHFLFRFGAPITCQVVLLHVRFVSLAKLRYVSKPSHLEHIFTRLLACKSRIAYTNVS